jgi:hypothetical protein
VDYAREMMALARCIGEIGEVGRSATLLGLEALRGGNLVQSKIFFAEALANAREANDSMLLGHSLVNLGSVLSFETESELAEELYRQAVAQFETVGDQWGIAYASNNLVLRRISFVW